MLKIKSFIAINFLFIIVAFASSASYAQNKNQQPAAPGGNTTQNVNVVNTPTVTLAPNSKIGIDPNSNTVKLDSNAPVTVRGEETVLAYDETINLSINDDGYTNPVDVSAFKQIRVVATVVSGLIAPTVLPRILLNADISGPVVLLDGNITPGQAGFGTKVYDLPGRKLDFYVRNSSYAGPSAIRIQVYGRK